MNIAFDAAVDIADTYGPYPKDWPAAQRAALDALEKNNPAFADHLAEMRDLEDQLSCWKDEEDGVEIEGDQPAPGGADSDELALDEDHLMDMDDMLAAFVERSLSEIDEPYRVFTKDFDELTEIDTTGAKLDTIQADTASAVGPLQKELTRLIAAKTKSVRLPGKRRGKINASSLHRVIAGDDRVFFQRQEAEALDTAISLVIDCSGSMAQRGDSAWKYGPLALATQAAFALGTVLNRIGVPFEVLGYTTLDFNPSADYLAEVTRAHEIAPLTRYTPLSYPKFKTFDEPFSLEVQRRFAKAYESKDAIDMNLTIEGCAVEFAARRLLAQRQKRKLMIVLSDGKPGGPVFASTGYGSSHKYMAHARQTVKEVTAAGIDLIGVGIKYAEIQTYYPNSIVIDNVAEMPPKLMSVLKRFLIK